MKTLEVAAPALEAHLGHGDYLGPCTKPPIIIIPPIIIVPPFIDPCELHPELCLLPPE